MKSALKATVFEHSETAASSRFTIKADGKAFRALIDGIYSDKITSCVRELATNAFDSHMVSGNSDPFFVHAPTDFKPEFYVRDYGVGMDHAKVMTLYSTMFDSDKTGDNIQAGMFGLGSKTPFAYTDQFHVTCYDGETSRLYLAGVGTTGVPEIHLFLEEPCAEKRGVKVGFAVENGNFSKFREAIQGIIYGFLQPFECNIPLDYLPPPKLQGTGWSSYQNLRNFVMNCSWYARQGCVLYPIVSHQGFTLPSARPGYTYIIDCPIGSLEVTTAREALAYTPSVSAYIRERMQEVINESYAAVFDKVKDIKSCAEFFQVISNIKPPFVTQPFVHPATGLSEACLRFKYPQSKVDVHIGEYDHKWTFHFNGNEAPDNWGAKTCYQISDFTPFLDKDHEDDSFSNKEMRRISRHLRMWMEVNKIQKCTFYIGVDKSEDFWAAFNPSSKVKTVKAEDILACIPGRPKEIKTIKYIRGLTLYHGKVQAPNLVEIDPTIDAVWVHSSIYQNDKETLSALLDHFKIVDVYVASAQGLKLIQEAKIPSLMERIEERFSKQSKISLDEFIAYSEIQNTWHQRVETLVAFVKRLEAAEQHEAVKKLKRAKTVLSPFFTTINTQKENTAKAKPLTPQLIKAMRLLESGKGLVTPDHLKPIVETGKLFADNQHNVAIRFIDMLPSITTHDLKTTVDAFISLLHMFPLKG